MIVRLSSIVHKIDINDSNHAKIRCFQLWHELRNPRIPMTIRFTHKELTILIGVLVAAIILLIIWTQPDQIESSETGKTLPSHSLIPSVKILIDKVYTIIQSLR